MRSSRFIFLSKINSCYSISCAFKGFSGVSEVSLSQVRFLKTGNKTREEIHRTVKTVINPLEECNCEVVRPCMYSRREASIPYCAGRWVLPRVYSRVHSSHGIQQGTPSFI